MKVYPKMSKHEQSRVCKPKIILNKGLPSEVKLPAASKPINMSKLSKKELDMEIQKGYDDMVAGKAKSAIQVFAEIRKDYNI